MKQASQTWYDGLTYYRWHIVTPTKRHITWALDFEGAKAKARKRGLKQFRIEPATSTLRE